LDFFEIFN